jgi:transcriptional regulator with XRE-family HTH domain
MYSRRTIDDIFRANLIRLRQKAGLSQRELSVKAKVPHLGAIETGSASAGKDVLIKLSNALKVSPGEFYREDVDASQAELRAIYYGMPPEGRETLLQIARWLNRLVEMMRP